MKVIKLSKGKYAKVDDCDFDMLNKFNWCLVGKGYAYRVKIEKGKRTNVQMHRVVIGTPKGYDTDHINGDKLDNRRSNLRICTRSQNIMNQPKYQKGLSKFRGVYFHKSSNKWTSSTSMNGKRIFLGYFATEEEAAKAYNMKTKELYGNFAYSNKI